MTHRLLLILCANHCAPGGGVKRKQLLAMSAPPLSMHVHLTYSPIELYQKLYVLVTANTKSFSYSLFFCVRIASFLTKKSQSLFLSFLKRELLFLQGQERTPVVALFKRARRFALFFFYKSLKSVIHIFLSSFQFSLQQGAKPTLKKSESLFHNERIALVFKKVKRGIR